jgi:hypothetical protein
VARQQGGVNGIATLVQVVADEPHFRRRAGEAVQEEDAGPITGEKKWLGIGHQFCPLAIGCQSLSVPADSLAPGWFRCNSSRRRWGRLLAENDRQVQIVGLNDYHGRRCYG